VKKSPVFGGNLIHPGPQHDGTTVDRLSSTPFAQDPDPTKLRSSLPVPSEGSLLPVVRWIGIKEDGALNSVSRTAAMTADITYTARIPLE
jgi:hypothetical protein